ncbi:hypothetical protein GCM10027596_35830 [Nocardioides korecus]
MSDTLKVEPGRRPWLPVGSALAGEVFDHFNVPRTGLIALDGVTYLFHSFLGDGGPRGLWGYAHVTEREVSLLESIEGPEAFDNAMEQLFSDRWVTVAAAANDQLLFSVLLDAGIEGISGLVDRFMKAWDMQIQTHDQLAMLRETVPA